MRAQLFLLLPALCWAACRADSGLPPPVEEPPYFSVTYVTDGLPEQNLVAGVADIYLFTDYFAGSDDVLTCTATFTEVQCPASTCAGRLRLEFRNAQLGSVVLAQSVFGLGNYAFRTNTPPAGATVYRTVFRADTTLGYSSFSWTFNSNAYAQGSPVTFDFVNPDSMAVTLRAAINGGPNSTVQRRLALTTPGPSFPAIDIFITPQGNAYRLEALSSGAPITSLMWNNGLTLASFLQDSLAPTYSVTAVDTQGNTAFARLEGLPADPGKDLMTANFTTHVTPVTLPPDTLQLGAVALEWTDSSGQLWRSDRGDQAAGTSFQILESAPYELNEQGQKTWQMRVAFICRLYNDSGQSIPFSGAGRVAVAYP